jgi:hypothetical protein
MIDNVGHIFNYFTSVIAVIALDLFLGTTMVQLHVNLNGESEAKKTLCKATTCWGLLNWILSMFLFFGVFNFFVIYILKKPIISLLLRILLLLSSILPYVMKKRYEELSWPGKNTASSFYFVSIILVLSVTIFGIPYIPNKEQDIRSVVHIVWPSIVIIFLQVINLARYGVWKKVLQR